MTARAAGKNNGLVKNIVDTDEVLEVLGNLLQEVVPDIVGSSLEGFMDIKSASGLSLRDIKEQLEVRIPMAAAMAGEAKKKLGSLWRTPPIPPASEKENKETSETKENESDQKKERAKKPPAAPSSPGKDKESDPLGFGPQTSESPLPQGSQPMEDLYPTPTPEEETRRAEELERQRNEYRDSQSSGEAAPVPPASPTNAPPKRSFMKRLFGKNETAADQNQTEDTSDKERLQTLPNFGLLLTCAAIQDIIGFALLFIDGGLITSLANIFFSGVMWYLLRNFQNELNAQNAKKKQAVGNNTLMQQFLRRAGLEFIPILNAFHLYTFFIISLKRKVESGELTGAPSPAKKSTPRDGWLRSRYNQTRVSGSNK